MGTLRTLLRVLTASVAAGCGGDDLYVMFEHFELKDGGVRERAGGGCMIVVEARRRDSFGASSGTIDPSADFRVSEQTRGDTLVVLVHSRSTELARRAYDETFLSSGKRDDFAVTTLAGRQFELAYWGGPDCDTSHLESE